MALELPTVNKLLSIFKEDGLKKHSVSDSSPDFLKMLLLISKMKLPLWSLKQSLEIRIEVGSIQYDRDACISGTLSLYSI